MKTNTCFKGKGTCIDLILTNRKYCFKHSSTLISSNYCKYEPCQIENKVNNNL